jgi:hypothetical protein
MTATQPQIQRLKRVAFVWLSLPVLCGIAMLAYSLSESCTNTVLTEIVSPTGEYKVSLFERKCTGTVAWTTHASVLPANSTVPDIDGNALVSFERHGSLADSPARKPEVEARWVSPNTVELLYISAAPIQLRAPAVERVKVMHVRTQ